MFVLGLIPARGGSRGVPRKNIRYLCGKPLIAWTLETALALKDRVLDRVIVSTDDPETADIARDWGGEVPFLRPAALAADDTPDLPVYLHTVNWLRMHGGICPDVVVWLRPTSPLRSAEDVSEALAKLIHCGADFVRSISPAEHHPYWMKRLDGDRLVPFVEGKSEQEYPRRQALPPAYRLNGAVDVIRCSSVEKYKQLYVGDVRGYVIPPERAVDIDHEVDFLLAEALLRRGGLG